MKGADPVLSVPRITRCMYCGTQNRIRPDRPKGCRPTCGRCKKALPLPAMFEQAAESHPMMKALLGGAWATLLLGLFQPLISISKGFSILGIRVYEENHSFSLVSGMIELLSKGDLFLFLVVFLFSAFFPLLKLSLISGIWFLPLPLGFDLNRAIKWLGYTGKWSMLDVFVVALLVFGLKLGDMVEVEMRIGALMFGISVLLGMLATLKLHHVCRDLR